MIAYILLGICVLFIIIYFDLFYYPREIVGFDIDVKNEQKGKIIANLTIQQVDELRGTIWASNGFTLYFSTDSGATFKKKAKLPISIFNPAILWNSKLIQKKVNKYDIMELIIIDDSTMIAFASGKIFRSCDGGKNYKIVHTLRNYGFRRGRGVFINGITQDSEGNIYYGEYNRNYERNGVNIYIGKNKGLDWGIFYTFKAGSVRHIHGLQYDPYTDKIWVATGDLPEEALIGYFDRYTRDLNILFKEVYQYVVISFIFTRDYVFWGADTPHANSHIYQFNRETKELNKIQSLNGPAYYAMMLRDGSMFISTTFEKHKGVIPKGQLDGNATIWRSRDGKEWSKIYEEEGNLKSRFYTYIRFPRGHSDRLIFNVLNSDKYRRAIIMIENL